MIVFFLGALIFAGMMFKANKKSVAWVLLAYITAGIFSIIYATKVSKKCKIDILKHDENRKQLNIELASVDNAINNTRQALRAAEQKLADFERINRL
ncbi:MAG: hypothetical protein J6U68_04280, partial [Clostridia bacterium]|nr:hypothetical protein [Clostridia bacterium]